jgi:hypothetical protein
MQLDRGPRHAALFDDLDKILELTKVHVALDDYSTDGTPSSDSIPASAD